MELSKQTPNRKVNRVHQAQMLTANHESSLQPRGYTQSHQRSSVNTRVVTTPI